MKLWNNTICANDIGTFMSVIFNRFSNDSKGFLYHTSKLEKTLKNDIQNRNKIIDIKLDNPFILYNNIIKENIIDNKLYSDEYIENNNSKINLSENLCIDKSGENFIKENFLKLRPYQIEAISKLILLWYGIKLLYLPCGTGKTIIYNEFLKHSNFKNVFIFSPLMILTEQNLENTIKYLPNYNHILVDTNGTRDFNVIKENLNKNTVYSSTFKSAEDIISKIFDSKEECILSEDTILIVDEAHNLLNLNNLIKIIQKFNKVLLVTATPPV